MTRYGNMRKGLGTGGAKRHKKIFRDTLQGISKATIRRLARRGGVHRISGLIYIEIREILKVFIQNIIRNAIIYAEYSKRRTVMVEDVIYALKRKGRTLYGFDD